MEMSFNPGDLAVYPRQGVTEVVGIECMEIGGQRHDVYVLKCLASDKKIRVPLTNVSRVGLRSVVDEIQIGEVMETLRAADVAVEEPNWNRRYRRYVEKIQSGNLLEVAQVLRDLHLTRADKQLSYGEKGVYETATNLLVQELSVAQGRTADEVNAQIEAALD